MADIGDKVYPTLAQLRQVAYVQSAGLVTVDGGSPDYDNPDRGVTFLTSYSLYFDVTEESAIRLGMHNIDRYMAQRIPGVDATSCDEDGKIDYPALLVTLRNRIGLYGPTDALDHTSWVGANGVSSPDSGGDFTVSGNGSLTLTLACNYDVRLGLVASGSAPEGPPYVYMRRRANIYYASEAVDESPYCWLGWGRVLLVLTAPSACTIDVEVRYRTYTFSDNHLSDSTRTTEFSFVATEHTATYSVAIASGSNENPVVLVLPDEAGYPLLERVVSIKLSGLADGSWTVGEPLLANDDEGLDAQSTRLILKTFEGLEDPDGGVYRHGGVSLHRDSSFEVYDANEDNDGHWNQHEKTVRFFDYRVGAVSGLDLTTVFDLDTLATLMSDTSEVYDVSVDTDVTDAMTKDDETPQDVLTGLYAFNACYPDPEDNDHPLLETIVDAANISLRGRTWAMATAIRYRFRTDAVREGRGHGVVESDGELWRQVNTGLFRWRRETTEEPVCMGPVYADLCGHWETQTSWVPFYQSPTSRYQYGVGPTADQITWGMTGYSREYDTMRLEVRRPMLARMDHEPESGRLWRAMAPVDGGDALVETLDTGRASPTWIAAGCALEGSYEYPDVACTQAGIVYVCATLNDDLHIARCLKWSGANASWEYLVMSDLGDGLAYGGIDVCAGIVYVCGYADEAIYLAISSDPDGLPRDTLPTGSLKAVCSVSLSDPNHIPLSSVRVNVDGGIYVLVEADAGLQTWLCRSLDQPFELQQAGT